MYKPEKSKSFGAVLKKLLQEKKLSQRKFAKQAGLDPSYVSKLVSPQKGKEIEEPRKEKRQLIAQGLGVTEQELQKLIDLNSNSDIEASNDELKILSSERDGSSEWLHKMIISAYLNRNSNQLKEAFIGLQSLENEPVTKLKNEASYLYLRYTGCHDTSALKELQNLTSQLEIYPYAYFLIGRCYEDTNNFEKATEAFEISAQAYQIEKERADSAIAVSRCLFKAGKQQKAFARLMTEIGNIIDSEIVSKVYESLAALYDEAKDSELQAFALEKALESRPYDTELLSRLAYSYEKHFDTLSLLHYQALIQLKPDDVWALNQIGINYRRLQMPIRSTKSYRKAVGVKSTLLDSTLEATFATDNTLIATLAAANLAYLYLDTGLVEEASMILEKAIQQKDVHPNVAHAISELKKREIAEAEIEKCSLKSASQQQRFIRSFAEAYFTEEAHCLNLFSGLWQLPNGVKVIITQTEEQIKARYNPDQHKEREYFSDHTSNRAARIGFTSSHGELYGYLDRIDGYIYLSSDAEQIYIMKLENQQHTVFTLIKID